jgi:BASS family bile acid:Na+ symporter
MPAGVLPEWLLPVAAAATIFVVMFGLGLAIVPGESAWVAKRPLLLGKALFAVLVAVPALAWIVVRIVDLPRAVEIGIVLMAIAPGAPVALRRSIGAGGHRSFAPALQIAVAAVAVISMPLSIAAFDEYYGGSATIEPRHIARQVLIAQLVPLAAGMLVRRLVPALAGWLAPRLDRVAGGLLTVLIVLALIDFWPSLTGASTGALAAIFAVTLLALAAGHLLGGPDPATSTATAIASAMRNPGLALVVATLNDAPPLVNATVVAYLIVSALTVLIYVGWRRRSVARAASGGS